MGWSLEYDNHGNGSFSEWWEIRGSDGNSIGRAYSEGAGRHIVQALSTLWAAERVNYEHTELGQVSDRAWESLAKALRPEEGNP